MNVYRNTLKIGALFCLLSTLIVACGPQGKTPAKGSVTFNDYGEPTVEKTDPDTGEVHNVKFTASGDLDMLEQIRQQVNKDANAQMKERNRIFAGTITQDTTVTPLNSQGQIITSDKVMPHSLQVEVHLGGSYQDIITFDLVLKNENGRTLSNETDPTVQLNNSLKYKLSVRCKDKYCTDSVSYLRLYRGKKGSWSTTDAIAGFHYKITHPKVFIEPDINNESFKTPELQKLYEASQKKNGQLDVDRSKLQVYQGVKRTKIKIYNPDATSEDDRLLFEIDSDIVDTELMASETDATFMNAETQAQLSGSNQESGNLTFDIGVLLQSEIEKSKAKQSSTATDEKLTPSASQQNKEPAPKKGSDASTSPADKKQDSESQPNQENGSKKEPIINEAPLPPETRNDTTADESPEEVSDTTEEDLEWLRIIVVEEGQKLEGNLIENPDLPSLENSIMNIKFDDNHPNTVRTALAFEKYRNHPKVKKLIKLYNGDQATFDDRFGENDGIRVAIYDRENNGRYSINHFSRPSLRMRSYLSNLPNLAPVFEATFSDFDIIPTAAHVTVHESQLAIEGNYRPPAVGKAGEKGAFQFMDKTAEYVNDEFNLNLHISSEGVDDRNFLVPISLLTAGYMKTHFDRYEAHDPAFMLVAHNSPNTARKALRQARIQNFRTTLDYADKNRMGLEKSRLYGFAALAFHFISLDPVLHGFTDIPSSPYSEAKPKIEKILFNGDRRPPGYENFQLPESI